MSECKVRRMTVEDLDAVTTIEAATLQCRGAENHLSRN